MKFLAQGLPPVFCALTRGSRAKTCRSRGGFFAIDHAQHFLRFGPVAWNEFARWPGKPVRAGATDGQIARLFLSVQGIEPATGKVGFHCRAGNARGRWNDRQTPPAAGEPTDRYQVQAGVWGGQSVGNGAGVADGLHRREVFSGPPLAPQTNSTSFAPSVPTG